LEVSKFFLNLFIVSGLQNSAGLNFSLSRLENKYETNGIINFLKNADVQIDTIGFEIQEDKEEDCSVGI